jgi:hypothetical protein
VDPSGNEELDLNNKIDVIIKHPINNANRPFWETDFGHAMLNIYSDVYDFGLAKDEPIWNGKSIVEMKKIGDHMWYYNNNKGAVFTVYELKLSDDEKNNLRNYYEESMNDMNNLPSYNFMLSNCVDFLLGSLKNYSDVDVEPFGLNKPTALSENMFKLYRKGKEKIINVYGGYEYDYKFKKVDLKYPIATHSNLMYQIETARDKAYGYDKLIFETANSTPAIDITY